MLKKIILLAVCAATAFAMHTGEINVNDTDVEVEAKFDVGQFNHSVEPNTMFFGAKFLNADEEHSSDKNASIDPYFELNFLMQKAIGQGGMTLGMGMKFNYTKEFASVPLGVEFSYKIPAEKLIPMYLHGSLYYAPNVLAFNDAKDFLEYSIGYDIEVIENGLFTLGYRNLDTNYDAMNFTYNKSWYVGFKIGF